MKHTTVFGMFMLALALLFGIFNISCQKRAEVQSLSEPPGPDFVSLFNGKDLTGWHIEPDSGAWVVRDGVLHCKGKPRGGYLLLTDKEYENFDFYAEFKISKGGNSGIFFHAPIAGAGRESRLGFEVQIIDDAGKEPNKNSTGSIYDQVAPKKNAMRPAGEWNQYRVLFDWPNCKVWLNGELVQDVDFSRHRILRYRLRRGYIGLSNHGDEVDYRNLWIKELPDKENARILFNGKDLSGWEKIGNADWHVKDGMIVATRGEGYLVTKDEFDAYHFMAYVENNTSQSRGGCFYYRWKSVVDPGYSAEFFDFPKAEKIMAKYKEERPRGQVAPLWHYKWIPYQIISGDRESQVRTSGYITSNNLLLNKVRPGKIAIYHSPIDGVLRIKLVKLTEMEWRGL